MARYPQIRVTLDRANPLALVAHIRLELRRAGVDRSEIQEFSAEALAYEDPESIRKVCSKWVGVHPRSRESPCADPVFNRHKSFRPAT